MERYKQECKKISEQIEPNDEFMQNLKANLKQKVAQEKINRKNFVYKVAMIFFTITLVSTGVFAKDIGNWLAQIFSNSDETMQIAVESGYVQNVDMDYVESSGIGIKVNSLIIDGNKMNIVFDIKGKFDGRLGIKEFDISGNDNYNITNFNLANTFYQSEFKMINKNNCILILKICNIEQELNNLKTLNIFFNKISVMKEDNIFEEIEGNWKCSVKIDKDNFKEIDVLASNYIIEENEYLENYKISVTNTGTNIELYFKENFDKTSLLNRNNIYIEKENTDKVVCRDFSEIGNNMLKLDVPITQKDEINNLKIVLNFDDEKIIFNVRKKDGWE